MWKIIKLVSRISFGLVGIFLLHATVANVLIAPFSYINVVILYLAWEYIYNKNEWGIWITFGLGLLLELFSGLPFGVTLFVILFTIIFTRLIFNFLFSDFTAVIIFILGAFTPFLADALTLVAINVGAVLHGNGLLPFTDLTDTVLKIFINGFALLTVFSVQRLFGHGKPQRLRPLGI